MSLDFGPAVARALSAAKVAEPVRSGRLERTVGLTLEANGLQAPVGALCAIDAGGGRHIDAEVVGFQGHSTYLMPFEEPAGLEPGMRVRLVSRDAVAEVGHGLLGRVVDGLGRPLDGKPAPAALTAVRLAGRPLNPMERAPIDQVLDVGVKAINGILTLGRGQRIGLMAGSGVGKSVLLGMMTRFTRADVVVIGLIGERGREVSDFIRDSLGEEGMRRSVVVAAPANVSPVLRLRAAQMAHGAAEYFRDRGLSVLLLFDSLTRVAHAQREVGLAVGEPPTAKGYTPSVFALLPNLIERTGNGRPGGGAITAVYTVLMEGDDASDPIVDIARASLDGQVMLSRALADAAHYPAIDLAGSISRLAPRLLDPAGLAVANRFRRLWTLYQQNADLIQVGAYQPGSNPELDQAIALRPHLENFLRQDQHQGVDVAATRRLLADIMVQ